MAVLDDLVQFVSGNMLNGSWQKAQLHKRCEEFLEDGGIVAPTGTISITENGTVDVTQYASASVEVDGSVLEVVITKEGSTYSADKSFEEMHNAISSGSYVYASYDNEHIPFNFENDNPPYIVFVGVDITTFSMTTISIGGDGTVLVTTSDTMPVTRVEITSENGVYTASKNALEIAQAMNTSLVLVMSPNNDGSNMYFVGSETSGSDLISLLYADVSGTETEGAILFASIGVDGGVDVTTTQYPGGQPK